MTVNALSKAVTMNDDVLATRQRSAPTLTNAVAKRFLAARGERGPHGYTRQIRIARPFHRLFSVKAGMRAIGVDGPMKAEAVLRAEADPTVVSLCERPMRILAPLGTRPHVTFDLGIVDRSGEEVLYLIERRSTLETGALAGPAPHHWSLLESWCERNAHRCAFITEDDLERDRVAIQNWRRLLGFVRIAREAPEPDLEDRLQEALADVPGLSLVELPRHVPPVDSQTIFAAVANLLHRGVLEANLALAPLTLHTPLRTVQNA